MKYILLLLLGLTPLFSSHGVAQNTSTGTGAGNSGTNNSSFGAYAGDVVTSYHNVFVGYYAGKKTTGGSNNTGNNTFVGGLAGFDNTTGTANTFIGFYSGYNYLGTSNTFLGYYSGYTGSGSYNLSLGYFAGVHSGTNSNNISLGPYGGYYSVGDSSVYIGIYAGLRAEGNDNLYIGNRAGREAEGSHNIFIGRYAGDGQIASNKLFIENTSASAPLIYGDFANDQVGINTSTTAGYTFYVNGSSYATGSWVSSDSRLKTDKQKITGALDKILSIEGFTYGFNRDAYQERNLPTGRSAGFIAQDIEKALPEVVSKDSQGFLAVNYDAVIPVLTEALKEQYAYFKNKIDSLTNKVDQLQQLVNQEQLNTNSSSAEDEFYGKVQLAQNYPNPVHKTATITYSILDQDLMGSVDMYIYNYGGLEIQKFENLSKEGTVQIDRSGLKPGVYFYSLVVGGTIVKTKKMIVY